MEPRPDAVIFDVDGVLVETEGSYIEAVVRTVQWLLVHDCGLRDEGPALDRATVRLWKRAAGWNDDWDLSYAMYCWLLAASGRSTTERRRAAEPPERATARTLVELDQRAANDGKLSWEDVRGLFEEIYNGTALALERYGVTPRIHQDRGLAESEEILLEEGLLRELAALGIRKLGIVTGRSRADWAAVARRMPLPPDVAVATMEDGRKPDPGPLHKVVRELAPRAFVAVGDTGADLELIQRWNATEDGRKVPGTVVMLCRSDDELAYREAGADLFIGSLADLPHLLEKQHGLSR